MRARDPNDPVLFARRRLSAAQRAYTCGPCTVARLSASARASRRGAAAALCAV